jgi:hypothetical protein
VDRPVVDLGGQLLALVARSVARVGRPLSHKVEVIVGVVSCDVTLGEQDEETNEKHGEMLWVTVLLCRKYTLPTNYSS